MQINPGHLFEFSKYSFRPLNTMDQRRMVAINMVEKYLQLKLKMMIKNYNVLKSVSALNSKFDMMVAVTNEIGEIGVIRWSQKKTDDNVPRKAESEFPYMKVKLALKA